MEARVRRPTTEPVWLARPASSGDLGLAHVLHPCSWDEVVTTRPSNAQPPPSQLAMAEPIPEEELEIFRRSVPSCGLPVSDPPLTPRVSQAVAD
jgi:hypothetical protein